MQLGTIIRKANKCRSAYASEKARPFCFDFFKTPKIKEEDTVRLRRVPFSYDQTNSQKKEESKTTFVFSLEVDTVRLRRVPFSYDQTNSQKRRVEIWQTGNLFLGLFCTATPFLRCTPPS